MQGKLSSNAYGPSIKPIVSSRIVPERRALFFFRFLWPWIRFVAIAAILSLTLSQVYGWVVSVGAAILYLIWFLFATYFRDFSQPSVIANWAVLMGHLVVAPSIFILLVFGIRSENSMIWLLFLIPVLTVGIELSRVWAFIVIFSAGLLAFFSFAGLPHNFLLGNILPQIIVGGGLRALIIMYVGFTCYLISRSLAYVQRLNERLLKALPNISIPSDWEKASQQAVKITAELFGEDGESIISNLLSVEGQYLYLTASSLASGQYLADINFSFPQSVGITGYVARIGEACFINNVDTDPEKRYFGNKAFPT